MAAITVLCDICGPLNVRRLVNFSKSSFDENFIFNDDRTYLAVWCMNWPENVKTIIENAFYSQLSSSLLHYGLWVT